MGDEPDYLGATADDDDVSSVLTEEERYRLREVIMTDEKIQTILKETHTTEQVLMIKDYRQIEKIIHPQKWDVLIRIIDNAGDQSAISGRKSSEDRSSTYGRKTTASSMTGQEMRFERSHGRLWLRRSIARNPKWLQWSFVHIYPGCVLNC